jgi:NADPH2:quinone reductase
MKAMRITAFGGPEVFEAADVPRPVAGPGQLLVRLLATSVNPVDYKIRRAGGWAGVKPPAVIGYDAAGLVETVGPGVTGFEPGAPVFYTPHIFGRAGTYAEFQVVEADIVVAKPSNLSFLEAASLPLAGGTAWDAIVRLAAVKPGETVLVHAGAGGVGSLAVQLAHAAGARVMATASAGGAALVRSLGAEVAIDYRAEDFATAVLRETGGQGVEVAFDTVGGDTLARTIPVMRPYGRMVTCVSSTGDLSAALSRNLTIHFEFLERARHKMEALRVLAERGQLRPVVDAVLPLERVADAHRKIEAGGMRGKLVLQVAAGADRR